MPLTDWLGTLGGSILLIAFALNLMGRLPHESRTYQGLNFLGAMVLMVVAVRLDFLPFIVLEGVWAGVSLLAMFGLMQRRA